MSSGMFDFRPFMPTGLPQAAAAWTPPVKYNFTGGNNDPEQIPVGELIEAANGVLARDGRLVANYGLGLGPQGYPPLREFIAAKLQGDAGIQCNPDDVLIVSGSLQAIDLVNSALLERGDTVIVEQNTYQGVLSRLARLSVNVVGVPLDSEGMRMDALADRLESLKRSHIHPKYIYVIPTVQNPSGTVMGEARRRELLRLSQAYGVPIVEDDCYADLIWDGDRPPALYGMSGLGGVIHIGSFSKSIAPALRVGYVVACWSVLSQMIALKTDGGSGALEQMVLSEFCGAHFKNHMPKLRKVLQAKLETLVDALKEQFGTAAEFEMPKGGIFLWVRLPEPVCTLKLYRAALAAGVAINPGAEWSTDKAADSNKLRLCFGSLSSEDIRDGIARLAAVCGNEFGLPERMANVAQNGVGGSRHSLAQS